MKINPEWKNARYELAYLYHGDKRKNSGYRFSESQLKEALKLMEMNPQKLYRIAIPKYLYDK